jgi:protein-tyrosine-phosphatase
MRVAASRWIFIVLAVALASVPSRGNEPIKQANANQEPTILFVCEHGAAKSVIAAAYFNKLAMERGLKYRAVFRGTNPDLTLAPAAEKGLKGDGIDTNGWKPEIITKKDRNDAARIVALGCAIPEKDTVLGKLTEWNDIPSVSENYNAARDDIVKRVERLVDELTKKQ